MSDTLPPMPEPYTEQVIEFSGIAVNRTDVIPLYTADQMRAYAEAYAAAKVAMERERCAKVCDEHATMATNDDGREWAASCAEAIRAG